MDVNEVIQLILTAPQRYEFWWKKLLTDAPQHILIETGLILFIIWLLFIRSTVDPSQASVNNKLSDKEIDELVDSWTPESIVPELPEKLENVANSIMVVESVKGNYLKLKDNSKEVLNLSSYDFLGLGKLDSLKTAARGALDKYGCGSCGPRGFYGTIDQHLKIEEAVAQFLGTEEAIAYSDGASTVSSAIPAFAKKGDLLVIDSACCEPILTGANLSRSTVIFFKHNDMADLERILKSVADEDVRLKRDATQQRRFIVVEGLYRNTGNILPLSELLKIKEKYCYRVIMDESLSFGTLGKTGRGVTEHYGVSIKSCEIIMVAMDTTLASIGGICVGSREIVDHQRLSGAGYCFSASAPPFLSTVAVQSLSEMEKNPKLLSILQENAKHLWTGLQSIAGVTVITTSPSPVIHVALDMNKVKKSTLTEDELIQKLSEKLVQAGVGITTSKFSIVENHAKKMKMRPTLRVTASASLSKDEINNALDQFKSVVKSTLL